MRAGKDLTQGPVFGHIVRMALPMMIGMTAHMLQNLIDGILVGRLGTQESLAVLNYGFPFFYLIFAVLNGVSTGASSILARLVGARERDRAEDALGQVAWVNLSVVALAALAAPVVLPLYLKTQGASAAGAALTREYLVALFFGLPFTALALVWGSGLRAEGNTRTLMNGMMLGTVANILSAPFLIFSEFSPGGLALRGLGLGVTGAGAATSLGGLVMAAVIGAAYYRRKTLLRFRWFPGWQDRTGVRETLAVGFPSILSQALIGINLAVMTHLAAGFGDAAVAAVGIGLRLDVLSVFPSLALMVAMVSLVGQNLGAKRYDRVRESVRAGLLSALCLLLGAGLLVYWLRAPLVSLFRPEPAVSESARHFLACLAYGYPFVGVGIVASGAFQGLGRGLPFLGLTILRLLLISAPAAWWLSTQVGERAFHYAPFLAASVTGTAAAAWILAAVRRLPREAPAPRPQEAPAP